VGFRLLKKIYTRPYEEDIITFQQDRERLLF